MRKLVFLVTTILVLGLLAACGAPAMTPAPTVGVPVTGPTEVPTAMATTAAPTTAATRAPSGALRTPEEAALAAAGGQKIGGTVTVLATWGGSEQDTFMAMIKPFQDATGTQVQYTGTRDLNAVLTTRVQGGNPPDLAGLPGPGQMTQFAQQGKLIDLSTVLDMPNYQQNYAPSWITLGSADGKLVGVFIKASVKGLIWYDPKVFQSKGFQTPKTWDEMMTLSKQMADGGTAPWCIGLESGAASGWPGTDWLEDIVLRQSGEKVYNDWWAGKITWSSPEIKKAWETFGQIVADPKMVYGGANTMLTTNFGDSGNPLFTNPPGCYLHHQASFITDFFTKANPNIKPVTDFDFFGFPAIEAANSQNLEVAGDLFGMFKDTPQARALMKYLVTPEAQAIWVQRGGAISPNKLVPLDTYPDPLSKKSAELLTSAQVTVFDASDLMPEAMNNAFMKAILDYVQSPNNLDSILKNLDSVQNSAYRK
ncbi:MAG: carbohydrate ABC transporter substrate-binding protein [Chloroflexi bacterium]|nr:carbohydrate ABC transporter substrate-binding protein [Chloroflexota bacterium]